MIHTVGPVWQGGDKEEARTLASCYGECLSLAATHDVNSMAFPAISTGIYGYPAPAATRVAVATVRRWTTQADKAPQSIVFCCFSEELARLYEQELGEPRSFS